MHGELIQLNAVIRGLSAGLRGVRQVAQLHHHPGDVVDAVWRVRATSLRGTFGDVCPQSWRLNQIPPGPFEKLAPSAQTATVFPVFVTSIAP